MRALLESLPQIDVYAKDGKGETAVQKVQGHSSKMARDITALIKGIIDIKYGIENFQMMG